MYTNEYPYEQDRAGPGLHPDFTTDKYADSRMYKPAQDYIHSIDSFVQEVQPQNVAGIDDIVASVFANQAAQNVLQSYHLAALIQERRALAEKHLADIKFRLDDLIHDRSVMAMLFPPSSLHGKELWNIERQILDLEHQQREIQTRLWKDTLELQGELLQHRTDYLGTRRRIGFLSGQDNGT